MKLISKLYILALSVFALFASCVDDQIINTNGNRDIEKGIPVNVTLDYGVKKSAEVSRAAAPENVERRVHRLYVIAFHSDGTVSTQNADKCGGHFIGNVENETGSGTIRNIPLESGNGQKIFIVANPGTGSGTLTKEMLDEVQSLDDFKGLVSVLNNKLDLERSSTFLMVGEMESADASGINIDETGKLSNYKGGTAIVNLDRVDARITFNVTAENNSYVDFKFEPKYYQVNNIPSGTYLVPRDKDYTGAGYASMSGTEINYFDGERDNGAHYFDFYMLENRLQPKQNITQEEKADADNLYALREKREKGSVVDNPIKPGQEYEPGAFKYANPNSTYVTIRGTLSYIDESQQEIDKFVNADVTYTIHLGNTGTANDADDPEKVNNYNTERNTHYTYNVTITGVESMRVEVVDDKEVRPGVEGDVIVAGGEVHDIDAHYSRAKIGLRRGDIKNGLSWAVSTPFQRGLKAFNRENFTIDKTENGTLGTIEDLKDRDELKTDLSLNDYKWVQFVINKEAYKLNSYTPVPSDNFVKYPGDQVYNGGEANTTGKAPAFGRGITNTSYYSRIAMYDVNQLLNYLYLEAHNDNSVIFDKVDNDRDNDIVAITAFVDEYLYESDPTLYYYTNPVLGSGDDKMDLSLWKKSVNGDNRMLHICKEGAQYSPDGATSWAESVITFSQRPVYTFYNPNSDVATAWGTESIAETDDLPVTGARLNGTVNTSTSNGRENMLNVLNATRGAYGGLQWDDVLYEDGDYYGEIQRDYNNIWYACIGRNRDLDGDNVIDDNEMQWYLASIDQLSDLWIGEAAIPNAKLYDQDKYVTSYSVNRYHIASSSFYGSDPDNPWVLWGEEGASKGDYNGSQKWANYGQNYGYRCVRNLGIDFDTPGETPDDYIKIGYQMNAVNNVPHIEYTIDVSRLESNTRRSSPIVNDYLQTPITERSPGNRPYSKFAVLVANTYRPDNLLLYPNQGSPAWLTTYNNERNGDPCPAGYRIPNQRELILMYMSFGSDFTKGGYEYKNLFPWENNAIMCKTAFGFNGMNPYQSNDRDGFVYNQGQLILLTRSKANENNVKVRCVRDIP